MRKLDDIYKQAIKEKNEREKFEKAIEKFRNEIFFALKIKRIVELLNKLIQKIESWKS